MSWRDEVAVKIVAEEKRMDLLRVPIDREMSLLVEFLRSRRHLTETEVEEVYGGRTNSARMRVLIDRLCCRMTTQVFNDLLEGVESYELANMRDLANELRSAYDTRRARLQPQASVEAVDE